MGLAIALLAFSALAMPAPAPPALYIDVGACPFECCTYRTWTTTTDTVLYARPERSAPTVGLLSAGTMVHAVTGQVHARPVRFRVTRARAGYRPGDVLFVYTYLGEGHFRVWRDGAMSEEDLGVSPYEEPPGTRCGQAPHCWGELEQAPSFDWWVNLRTEDGREGWSDQPDHFGNKDGCG